MYVVWETQGSIQKERRPRGQVQEVPDTPCEGGTVQLLQCVPSSRRGGGESGQAYQARHCVRRKREHSCMLPTEWILWTWRKNRGLCNRCAHCGAEANLLEVPSSYSKYGQVQKICSGCNTRGLKPVGKCEKKADTLANRSSATGRTEEPRQATASETTPPTTAPTQPTLAPKAAKKAPRKGGVGWGGYRVARGGYSAANNVSSCFSPTKTYVVGGVFFFD